jgi:arylformamidase
MSAIDYEAEYNNRRRVPDHEALLAPWLERSKAYRASACNAELDLKYGPAARNAFDLFHPASGAQNAPLVVYIHGGYWQRGHHHDYAWIASELNKRGVSVALPTYTLCPDISVMGIVDEMRAFLAALWKKTGKYPVVTGHSAGGQLTAAMMATDWSQISGVPRDLVRTAYAISGVFDVPPLVDTSLNEALKLTAESARIASPMFWPAPKVAPGSFVAAVGGAESDEFLRQSLDITYAWSQAGVTAECVVVPRANHFSVVHELGNPRSAMLERVIALARQAGGG